MDVLLLVKGIYLLKRVPQNYKLFVYILKWFICIFVREF